MIGNEPAARVHGGDSLQHSDAVRAVILARKTTFAGVQKDARNQRKAGKRRRSRPVIAHRIPKT